MTEYVDDLDAELGLDLPRDEDTLASYEETPLADTVDGYVVENYKGLDIAVLGHPKEASPVSSGANPAHLGYFEDDDYQAKVTISPRPIDFDGAFRFDGEDVRIGTDQDGVTPDEYVELEERDQPGRAVRELIDDRDDIAEGARERVARYVVHDGDRPVDDGSLGARVAALLGEEPVDRDEYDRVQDLARHFGFERRDRV
ncbi:MAG: hypothetical protein SV186_04795 [Candidatus Nanohaloarchaea archaeon]|nr:hypothetical protein [Candidatus Nanohaloarchaea archaeon]